MTEHSPARILQVRAKLYDLLSHCIPPTTILKAYLSSLARQRRWKLMESQTLTFKLIPKIDDALKADIIRWSAFYEHRIRMGTVSVNQIGSFEEDADRRWDCRRLFSISRLL